MSKRIVFCADGTWDSAQNDTNVYKLFKAIPITSDQVAFYDDGVGSDGTPSKKLQGAHSVTAFFKKSRMAILKSRTCMSRVMKSLYSVSVAAHSLHAVWRE